MVLASSLLQPRPDARINARPILKWAGGKSQLVSQLIKRLPKTWNRYIEPFFGGGALFFSLQPSDAVVADSNPELINLYLQVRDHSQEVARALQRYRNEEHHFYRVREQKWEKLEPIDAAARTIYLNKTCFNGLYRVNRKGQFNVPFGRYTNPRICDAEGLSAAAYVLRRAKILCADYKTVLREHARQGDLIFLDPPYLPISAYSDFKRYTKEQFYEEDHIELAKEVQHLHTLGCHVILTNSNHPLVHDSYGRYEIEVFSTRRHINSKAKGRTGEDVIVNVLPRRRILLSAVPAPLPEQVKKYPPTRFMGSKNRLLMEIWDVASQFKFESVLDLFSGSGVVGYMFKAQGKRVIANDYMFMNEMYAKAMIENNEVTLSARKASGLLRPSPRNDKFVQATFKGLYFSDDENKLIDNVRGNIKLLRVPFERAIATTALMRACTKKRPRGIFTYTGHRYDDGRRDLILSFEDQFLSAVDAVNNAVFSNNKKNRAQCADALMIKTKADLVYIDPPYFSPLSDNEYVRRYHFVEGIARNWNGVEIQEHTQTKKFKSYPTPFSSRKGAAAAFDKLFSRHRDSILVVSYSSNSLPTLDEMVDLIAKYKRDVQVVSVDLTYSFANQGNKVEDIKNSVKEYLFIGSDG